MTYRIQTKKSDIAALKPHPSELLPGELAVNYSDMVLYALGTDGAVHQISGSGGGGGDLVAMDYTFWVKTVAEGESAQLFTGIGDAGSTLAINLDGFDVALNGVSLDPNIDYTPDAVSVALTEPARVGDVLIVRNLVADDGVVQGESLNTSNINITSEDRPQYYDDLGLQTQQDVNWYLLDKFESIEVPELPDDLATTGDITAAVEGLASEEFVTEQIAAIEIPEAPESPEAPDLSKYAEKTYVDSADQAVQRYATAADEVVLNAAKKYTDDSQGPEIATNVMVTDGEQAVESGWKLMSGGRTLVSVGSSQVGLYHVKEPTDDAHPVTRGYGDTRYQFHQKVITFKCDQYATASTSSSPRSGEFCGLNNSSQGSATSPNPYFGNWNAGIRIAPDKLLNPEGNEFSDTERYTIQGTVTILDKSGKLYFKAAVSSVSRTNNNSYVSINFASRVPAFGTGSYNDSDQYVVIVEGLESVQPATANTPGD